MSVFKARIDLPTEYTIQLPLIEISPAEAGAAYVRRSVPEGFRNSMVLPVRSAIRSPLNAIEPGNVAVAKACTIFPSRVRLISMPRHGGAALVCVIQERAIANSLPCAATAAATAQAQMAHQRAVDIRIRPASSRRALRAAFALARGRRRYLTSVSILNIGMYMAMITVPTIRPTRIIITGSMMLVSDETAASTSSS